MAGVTSTPWLLKSSFPHYRLRVSCTYSVHSNTSPVNIRVLALPPPIPKTQPGPLSLELQIAKGKVCLFANSSLKSKSVSRRSTSDQPCFLEAGSLIGLKILLSALPAESYEHRASSLFFLHES